MSGYPDYTQGVTITGYTITSLPIDIVAQTIGNIEIDIAAQTVGNIAVNLAASAITLDINIAASAVTLDINIASAAVTINVATAVGEHVDTDIVSSIQLDINIAASAVTLNVDITAQTVGNISIDIAAQSVGNVAVNIAASAVTINVATAVGEHVDTDIVSSIQLDINIAASAVTLNVDIVAQTVGNISIDIAAQSVGNVAINIAASAISLNIKTTTGEHVDTDIVSSIQLDINIAASAITLNVDITAQTVGNIAVNLAASAITLDVDIAAQTVDLNIKTSGETNIVIDKLTQAAYTERRSVLSNDNGVTTPTAPPGVEATTYRGKFYPRGCRGFIEKVEIYAKATNASGTITLAFAPYIGAGPIFTVDISITSTTWNWYSANVRKMWNYDSMFIYATVLSTANSGYDTSTPYDGFYSADSGVTWISWTGRHFYRVTIKAQTVGDIPVSGTLNTIRIPNRSDTRLYAVDADVPLAETDLKNVYGMGNVVYLRFRIPAKADAQLTMLRVYCDGNLVWQEYPAWLSAMGYTATSPDVSLLQYGVDDVCIIHLGLEFGFRRRLRITAESITTADQYVEVEGAVNLLT